MGCKLIWLAGPSLLIPGLGESPSGIPLEQDAGYNPGTSIYKVVAS